MFYITWSEKLD